MSQWRIQGRGPGTPLFLVETEARGAEKQFFWDPPPLISGSSWPRPTLLSQGLDLPLVIVLCGAKALYICVLLWTGIFFSIRHFHIDHNAPCLPPKSLHNLCLRFLLGRCNTPEKYNWKQWLCKIWGVNKVHYYLCENIANGWMDDFKFFHISIGPGYHFSRSSLIKWGYVQILRTALIITIAAFKRSYDEFILRFSSLNLEV